MKPPPFEYRVPQSIDEALSLLASHGEDAKVLAGGQSLVPAMNFRLARPEVLVDINALPGLDGIEVAPDALRLGALVRHARLETPVTDDALGRLLAAVSRYVGHLPIRVRGTFCGSLAHADPAAEWCAATLALDGEMTARSTGGSRTIRAADFFDSPFTTALRPDELLTEASLPLLGPRAGVGFIEHSRTAGDFALVAALAVVKMDDERVSEARLALAGVEGRPLRPRDAEQALAGTRPEPKVLADAATLAAERADPIGDPLCSASYRRQLVRVTMERALEQACREVA